MKFKPLKTFSIAVVLIYFYGVPILYKYESAHLILCACVGLGLIVSIFLFDKIRKEL